MGDLNESIEKINETNKFSLIFVFLSSIILLIAFIYGPDIFILFTGSDIRLSVSLLLLMIMFAVFKNFIGYHQSIFQALKLDYVLLGILIFELMAASYIYLNIEIIELEIIVEYIFNITGVCAFILLIFLIGLTSKYHLLNTK
jgi:hypothetical protein